MLTTESPNEQLCNIDANAATPFSPYPYPTEVGTPITGIFTVDDTTDANAPSIPAATIIILTSDLMNSFKIGNIIPRIISIATPDTITRPSGATLSLHLVSATVFDADGLDNIKWVGFTSYHVEGDSMMNKGNYIYLYDDGSENIIYLPDITSGDLISGDGTYSFKIPVFGSGNTDPDYQTKPGTFKWEFITQDREDEYSLPATHEVVIQ